MAQHFAKKTEKSRQTATNVHDVSYELTGSELVALLLESGEIKPAPAINRAQRVALSYIITLMKTKPATDASKLPR